MELNDVDRPESGKGTKFHGGERIASSGTEAGFVFHIGGKGRKTHGRR